MATQAQVLANRRNAAKSTGPKTPEGKAIVAQNAVKHGLWARQPVLKDEDPAEFEMHRSRMLQSLVPDGPQEEALAERIVGLWWRLKRAERMQDEALDYLLEADRDDDWVRHRWSLGDPSAGVELTFGRAVARDFGDARALDRLSLLEQRIEGGLYKAMKQLGQIQRERKSQDGHGSAHAVSRASRPRSEGETPSTQETPCGRVAPPNSSDGADSDGPGRGEGVLLLRREAIPSASSGQALASLCRDTMHYGSAAQGQDALATPHGQTVGAKDISRVQPVPPKGSDSVEQSQSGVSQDDHRQAQPVRLTMPPKRERAAV